MFDEMDFTDELDTDLLELSDEELHFLANASCVVEENNYEYV